MKEEQKYRFVVLVRHGQYNKDPEKLSSVGVRQARLTARALLPRMPAKLFSSKMPRAKETADIIGSHLGLKVTSKAFFNEGILPGSVSYRKNAKGTLLKKIQRDQKSVDEAFRFLFERPFKFSSCEVVVAHGNIIRHWLCKSLKISPAKNWMRMDLMHASLTIIRVDKVGRCVLLAFGDTGHLSPSIRTYS